MSVNQCSIVLTRQCNLRCDFCFAKNAGYSINDRISLDNLKKIVDFCDEAKIKYIFFSGGEPLLYPKLFDILQYIQSKRSKNTLSPAIATNGILLKDIDFCQRLIDCGVDYIDISMKGANSAEWKEITGYDGLQQQLQGIQNLSKLGVQFTCSMVVTHDSIDSLCETVRSAVEHGAKQISFTFVIDNISTTLDSYNQQLLKNNPYTLIKSFIEKIDDLNRITDCWWIEYSLPLCIYTDEQLQLLENRLASPCQVHKGNSITVNTNLELLPCDMYFDQPLGKFGQDFNSYQEFLSFKASSHYQNQIKEHQKYPSTECESCSLLTQCYGGCPVLWRNSSLFHLKELKAITEHTLQSMQ